MKCKKCGAENLDDAKFCSSCGSRLDAKYCQKCGKVNPDNAKFCNYCGNLLDSEGTNEENVEYNQENTIRCRICGHINPNTENYCKLCGSQLTPNNGPQATYSASYNTYNTSSYDPRGDAATPSMIIGIVALVLSVSTCLSLVGIIVGIIGLIKSSINLKKNQGTRSKALAGFICSIIAIVLGILMFAYVIAVLNSEEFRKAYEEAWSQAGYIRMLLK